MKAMGKYIWQDVAYILSQLTNYPSLLTKTER